MSPGPHVAVPHAVDRRGRTAAVGDAAYVNQLVAQVLFTAPGERINRPTFGSGLTQLLFAPADPSIAAAAQLAAQTALQTWLGNVLVLDELTVEATDATFRVTVTYSLVASGERTTVTFDRGTFAAAGS